MNDVADKLSNSELSILRPVYEDPKAYFLIKLSSLNGIKEVHLITKYDTQIVNAKKFRELFKKIQFMPYRKNNIKYKPNNTKIYKARPVTLRLKEIFEN